LHRAVFGLSRLVGRAPRLLIVAVLGLTVLLAGLASQVQVASGAEGFAPDRPEVTAAETISNRFGETGEEVVQVLVRGPDVISADGLAAVDAITTAVAESDAAAHLAERADRPSVVSWLGGVQQALAAGGPASLDDETVKGLFGSSLAQLPPEQAGMITGLLGDGADVEGATADAGLVLVFLRTGDLPEDVTAYWDGLIERETAVVDAVAAAALPAGMTADGFSFALLFADDGTFDAELARLFSSAFVIIILILGFVYWLRPGFGATRIAGGRRTVADVLLTMATIVMAILWMNGAATLLGPGYLGLIGPMTDMTQIIPVLLIGLGVDYAIHLTSRYREEVGAGASVEAGIVGAVRTVGIALVLATVTTAVGFLTNIVNPVPALRDFGILAAVGIVSAFVLMLTFVPAIRLLLDRRAEAAGRLPRAALGQTSERSLPRLMARASVLAERAPVATLAVTVVLGGGLGIWGLSSLETRFSATDFVPEGSPLVATMDEIADRFGGGFGETTEVLVTGDLATPAAHNALVDSVTGLGDVDGIARLGDQLAAESPVSALAVLTGPGPDGHPLAPPVVAAAEAAGVGPDFSVPADADVGALYAAMAETAPELTARVLVADDAGRFEMARIGLQTTAGESGAAQLSEDLKALFAPMEAAGAEVVATSNPIINHVVVSALQESQVSSMAITLLAAMLLLVANFGLRNRRPLLGVITTFPVVLVVLWTFGMMAATGIPFGPITATIAALAIGIGVPYSIHITHRFQEDRLRFDDTEEAIRSTVRHTGGALAGSAFTTAAGFGILVTSSLVPFRQFGLVTAYAILFALLAATIVLPSMLALWDRYHRPREALAADPDPIVAPAPV
jgi:uncharacterized protein